MIYYWQATLKVVEEKNWLHNIIIQKSKEYCSSICS